MQRTAESILPTAEDTIRISERITKAERDRLTLPSLRLTQGNYILPGDPHSTVIFIRVIDLAPKLPTDRYL